MKRAVYVHPMARPWSEERVACFCAGFAARGGSHALAASFVGLAAANAALRCTRSWT